MSEIKELKEAISVGFALAKIIAPQLKDGWQLSDLHAIAQGMLTEEFVSELKLGIEGADKINDEAKNIGLFSGIELSRFVLSKVTELQA